MPLQHLLNVLVQIANKVGGGRGGWNYKTGMNVIAALTPENKECLCGSRCSLRVHKFIKPGKMVGKSGYKQKTKNL
jgi:hypothetical protein